MHRLNSDLPSKTIALIPPHLEARTKSIFVVLALIAIFWAIELWWMQHLSMPNHHSGGPQFDFWAPKIRFVLDVFFAGALVFLLPRWLLVGAWIFSFVASVGLIAYAQFFNASLSILTVLNGWREGAMLAVHALAWLPMWPMLILAGTLFAKCVLIWKVDTAAILPTKRWRVGLAFVAGYFAIFAATTVKSPLSKIATTQGVARVGRIRGYLGPWAAELYYLNSAKLLEAAIERASYKSDQLTPLEYPIKIQNNLSIVQAESLDFNVLGMTVDGREVTPFLNQLRNQSLFYKARAFHRLGSADADFTMLAGGPPATNILNYSIPGFPYDNALPHFLANYGFKTWAFHGNYGSFYRRMDAFRKMGFTEILFREQLSERFPVTIDGLGIKDADVFKVSSLLMRQSTSRACHFIITLTSHGPYQFVQPDASYPYPEPRTMAERYFNHVHYLDSCLRDYIQSLGNNATVVIYADHPTDVRQPGFAPCIENGTKYVPVFIYDGTNNFGEVQQTRSTDFNVSGEVSMIDISTFLRNRIAATFGETPIKFDLLNPHSNSEVVK